MKKKNKEDFLKVLEALTEITHLPKKLFETEFGPMALPLFTVAKSIDVTRRGKVKVKYQLNSLSKKQIRKTVKETLGNARNVNDVEVMTRAFITQLYI